MKPAVGVDVGARVGRYIVIRRLGAGAMGVVYAAYDPKLDRKVALKLLARIDAGDAEDARQRLQREALALAKLTHPNVVGVHDVDMHEGRLFVAMEFVAGRTLGGWMHEEPRPWRAVLDVFLAAGRGLAAAHAAGLVHRDFKPENVMVGEDGRVRVMDFGLARPQGALPIVEDALGSLYGEHGPPALETPMTVTGTWMGTPAYMAREQFEGKADARSDQFSFCVALYEGLYGERPFPGDSLAKLREALVAGDVRPAPRGATTPTWLRSAVLRGLAPDPERRWPSMDALLAVLADDPARRRRRWAGVTLGVAFMASIAGGAVWYAQGQARACEGFEARLAGVWDDATRSRVRDAFNATGLAYADDSWRGASERLDEYTRRWAAARRDACEATQRGEQSGALLDLRMACLSDRLRHVKATTEILAAPDQDIVRKAVEAVAGLPGIERCADADALAADQPPPDDLAVATRVAELDGRLVEARALWAAGKHDRGLEVATAVVTEAAGLGYEPLAARAWLVQGTLQDAKGAYADAEATLERAYASAVALTMTPEAAEAARLLILVVGHRLARPQDGRGWAKHAEPLTRAVGTAEAEAHLLGTLASVAMRAGSFEESRTDLERALVLREQILDPHHPDLAITLSNLGLVAREEGKLEEARAYYERSLAIGEEALGPDHPDLAIPLNNLGQVAMQEGRLEEARASLERALTIRERALGPDHPGLAHAYINLGTVALKEGKLGEARADYERALAIWEKVFGPDHPSLAQALTSLANVALLEGKLGEARAEFERALVIEERALGPDHPDLAIALTGLGETARMEGRLDESVALYERAIAILEKALGLDHDSLAHPSTGLGAALLALRRPADAIAPLERSVSVRSAHPGDPVELADSRFALARALWDAPSDARGDRTRADELAELAVEAYAAAGERAASNLAEVRAWQSARGR